MSKSIKLKSLKEPKEPSDSFRILIARFRPRYLPKYKENWDEWWKDLAPSRPLWKEYLKDKTIDWPEYSRRYIYELKNNPEAIQLVGTLSSFINDNDRRKHTQQPGPQKQKLYNPHDLNHKYDVVTLLCHCIDETYCHRSIVKTMILEFAE